MTWWAYVTRLSGGATNVEVAAAVGISPPSVSRWKTGSNPDPKQAAAFARAYGRPVLEAFVAAGFLTSEEARQRPSAAPSLAQLSDDDLLAEVASRMKGGSDAGQAEAEKSPGDDGGAGGVRPIRPAPDPQYDPDVHAPRAARRTDKGK